MYTSMRCDKVDGQRAAAPPAAASVAHRRRRAGLSLVEMLMSLAITGMLLTATMVAIDASFRAYASAAESASTQTATRLVTHRLLTLIRTSTAHGPLEADSTSTPPVTQSGNALTSHYLELIDSRGNHIRVEYRDEENQMWLITTPYGSTTPNAQPLLGGVSECEFHIHRRLDRKGIWVLDRASMQITVETDRDTTLVIEHGQSQPVRYFASTMPRKIE